MVAPSRCLMATSQHDLQTDMGIVDIKSTISKSLPNDAFENFVDNFNFSVMCAKTDSLYRSS